MKKFSVIYVILQISELFIFFYISVIVVCIIMQCFILNAMFYFLLNLMCGPLQVRELPCTGQGFDTLHFLRKMLVHDSQSNWFGDKFFSVSESDWLFGGEYIVIFPSSQV